jgi:hypothetical protein
LCFFFRMRLRRFLIREPIRVATLPATAGGATFGTTLGMILGGGPVPVRARTGRTLQALESEIR